MACDSRVFVVLPVHNRWEQTRSCLGSLAGQTYGDLRVVLVDDGSTDGTRQHVEREFPGVTLLEGDGTLWWAGGVNRGIHRVLGEASPKDFLLILNNDIAFGETFVADLFRESADRGGAALFPPGMDKRTGEPADTGFLVDWKGTRIVSAPAGTGGGPGEEPDAFSTRGLFLPVPVVSAAGLLRERELPHYLSDIEYTIRIRRMGLPIFRSRRVTTVLDTGTSGLHTASGTGSPWRDIRDRLFDYRSPSNIVHWLRFLRICCPRRHLPRWILRLLVSEAKSAVRTLLAGSAGTR